MLKIIFDIVCGLNHLHMEIVASSRRKPSIAHRSLNTKHILLKNDGTCCIAGLRYALSRTCVNTVNSGGDTEIEHGVGLGTSWGNGLCLTPPLLKTVYHSPEVLTNTMNFYHFDSHLKVDIYALGVCMWEICTRTVIDDEVKDYRAPFNEYFSSLARKPHIVDDIVQV